MAEKKEGKTMEIPFNLIDNTGRFRQEMGNIDDLAKSIADVGLIHPPTLLEQRGGYKLLAGGRRLMAMKQLGWEKALFNVFTRELEEWEMRKIELLENDQRKEMTWYERNSLVAEYHKLMESVEGKPTSKVGPGSKGHTIKKTAEAFGISSTHAKRSMDMNDQIEKLPPELRKIVTSQPTPQAAQRVLENAKKTVNTAIASSSLEKELEKDGGVKGAMVKAYIVGDFFKEVRKIGNETVDLVEIDPPYAISLMEKRVPGKSRKDGLKSQDYNYNEVDVAKYPEFLDNTLKECVRVMKENSWLILWHANEHIELCRELLIKHGLKITRPAIWIKTQGEVRNPRLMLGSAWEGFFYARKGVPYIVRQGRLNVFNYTAPSGHTRIHPTERPLELIEDILTTFTSAGSFVLVPFAGSGNTIRAAYNSGMKAIGYDLSGYYHSSYIARIGENEK